MKRNFGTYFPGGRKGWKAVAGAMLLPALKVAVVALAFFAALFACFIAAIVLVYVSLAASLPEPQELLSRSSPFRSTRIYDRAGNLLYEILDPHGGRRIVMRLPQISPYLRQATIATEDKNFYRHSGVDPFSLARAVWQNLNAGEVVSGGSTIPQQLARLVFLSPEERMQRTIWRKVKEAFLAAEITRRYSKEALLEIYLNEIYYGNLAYGIEAAAQTYFGKRALDLTLAEAALLAGLPQSPSFYDPFTRPEAAKKRQKVVLNLMVREGYISPAEAQSAWEEELSYAPFRAEVRAPHFTGYVRQLLEEKYGSDVLYRSGFQVYTTLDLRMQAIAERVVREELTALAGKHVTNAALVALRPDTGEILAMVGSADFFNTAIGGQVNVALRPRQPGSAIKPITYLAAFEKGWTPATLIMDVETDFPDGANPPYKPVNYDGRFHGPVLVRTALGSSYNVPAVKTLQFVGLPAMLEMAHRLGIRSLNRPDYGLSLTLGGGEVTLLELTSAYAVLANGGRRVPPVAVLRLEDGSGHVIEEYRPPPGEQVISAQHAYLITDILADNEARTPAFGPNSVLRLSRPAAVKTGTTTDFRDAWTVGYTSGLVAGVWVGNSDNSPMQNVPGSRGAAPIWHNFMEEALAGTSPHNFPRPPGIETIEICADSGTRPSPACPHRKMEIFAAGQGPFGPERDLHQFVKIDRSTGQLATLSCPPELVEERYYIVFPPEYRRWAEENGYPQPPSELCTLHPGPPASGSTAATPAWPTPAPTPLLSPWLTPSWPTPAPTPLPSSWLTPSWPTPAPTPLPSPWLTPSWPTPAPTPLPSPWLTPSWPTPAPTPLPSSWLTPSWPTPAPTPLPSPWLTPSWPTPALTPLPYLSSSRMTPGLGEKYH